jgi:hypothetical protein
MMIRKGSYEKYGGEKEIKGKGMTIRKWSKAKAM